MAIITRARPKELPEIDTRIGSGPAISEFAFKHPGWLEKACRVLNEQEEGGVYFFHHALAIAMKDAYELGLSRAMAPEGPTTPRFFLPKPPDPVIIATSIRMAKTRIETPRSRFMLGTETVAKIRERIAKDEATLASLGGDPEPPEESSLAPGRVTIRSRSTAKPTTVLVSRRR